MDESRINSLLQFIFTAFFDFEAEVFSVQGDFAGFVEDS
jgi:hypothetical protein